MKKRFLLTWFTVLSMFMLTFPIVQVNAAPLAAALASKKSPGFADPAGNIAEARHKWRIVGSANVGVNYNLLQSVAAVSASDVWAVGFEDTNGSPAQTLIEQWNGSSWSVVPSPNVGTSYNELQGGAAVSATDVWAVGYYDTSQAIKQTLIEQWNGTSWSVVPSPNVGTGNNTLQGVAVVSANDVWAVGYAGGQPLIENWNGTSWNVIPSPNYDGEFFGVAVISPKDVWAVGVYTNNHGYSQVLIENWNGSSWNVVPGPDPGVHGNYLNGVTAISASDVWAVGFYENGLGFDHPLTEHWNGKKWSDVKNPTLPKSSFLVGVASVSNDDVWAVGYIVNGNLRDDTLIEHWNGSHWSVVPSPNRKHLGNALWAVAAISTTDVWAVGFCFYNETLTEHYS